ncbi:MAG TPA: pyrimidine 5'-nucleotidase [Burkholderiales bacterium]|nr:pyrimidine 5'-nucleotidase [Burkholderiales bacterium]
MQSRFHGRTWIFDLDNTLHDARPHIFPHIDRSMTAYLAEHLGLGAEAANELRQVYWRRYGATLVGLIRHHRIDPHHFLRETHRFPQIERQVVGRRELRSVLRRLPGRKFVFSNAPAAYSRAVLAALGVNDLFDDVFTIEHTRFRPKPDVQGFRRLLRTHRLLAARCIMVEDSLENLRTAKRLGMKTVWVDQSSRAPAWVDANVRNIVRLPRLLHLL